MGHDKNQYMPIKVYSTSTQRRIHVHVRLSVRHKICHINCNMYGVYQFSMFTKFLLTQILEILMVNKLCKQGVYLIVRFF